MASLKETMGTRGHCYESVYMDYPKNSASHNRPISHSFIIIPDCPLPLLGKRFADQDRSSDLL